MLYPVLRVFSTSLRPDQTVTETSLAIIPEDATLDAYYRVQLTPQIQIGPTFGIVFDPVNNPEEDTVYVAGLRARIYF